MKLKAKPSLGIIALASALAAVPASTTGCGQPIFPVLTNIEQVVANDLAAGKTDAQMAADVCQALGGSSLEDALCADATQMVTDAVEMLINTNSISGKALVNAKAYRAAHAPAACKQ